MKLTIKINGTKLSVSNSLIHAVCAFIAEYQLFIPSVLEVNGRLLARKEFEVSGGGVKETLMAYSARLAAEEFAHKAYYVTGVGNLRKVKVKANGKVEIYKIEQHVQIKFNAIK